MWIFMDLSNIYQEKFDRHEKGNHFPAIPQFKNIGLIGKDQVRKVSVKGDMFQNSTIKTRNPN